jgi:hypothetical protein
MNRSILILGDILAILITTLIGFATHDELGMAFVGRMSAAFFPLLIAWFLLAPFLGLFQEKTVSDPKQLWRPVFAMLFAAPFAAVLRGFILNAPIIPIFALVLASTSALGILVWRAILYFVSRGKRQGL